MIFLKLILLLLPFIIPIVIKNMQQIRSKINKILFDPLCQISLESKFIPNPLIIDINNVASNPLANPILYKLYPLCDFML